MAALCAVTATQAPAAGYADYSNVFSFTSQVEGEGNAIFFVPTGAAFAESAITGGFGGFDYGVGDNILTHTPYFFSDTRAFDSPTETVMMSLSTLNGETSVYGLDDIDALHLVVTLNNDFLSMNSILGVTFETAFAGFGSTFDNGGNSYAGFTERAFIVELLYIAALDQQYGLPASPNGGPQTNLLFDFGYYLTGLGASITTDDSFTLVAFSEGSDVGSGQLLAEPSGIGGPGSPPAIPEPAVWTMMILGFGLVGAAQRRGSRRTVALA